MVRKSAFCFVLIIMIALLAGCWDSIDINDKDITMTVAVDYKEGEYFFYTEIPNISGFQNGQNNGSKNQQSLFSVPVGSGKTFIDARKNLDSKLDKPVFLGTTRALVLTERMAKNGITAYMFRMQSLVEYRKAVGIITTREELDTLFDVRPENNDAIGYALEETIETLSSKGTAVYVTSSEILEWLYSQNTGFIIPNFDVRDEHLSLTGYTAFENGEYAGFIKSCEANGILWFLNDRAQMRYIVPIGDNEATVQAKLKKREIVPEYSEGSVSFDISFELDSCIKYLSEDIKLSEEELEEVRRGLQKLVVEDLIFSIRQAKGFGCEYLGLDEKFRIEYPDEYKQLEWRDAFIRSEIRISVRSSIDPGGMMKLEEEE